MDEWICIDTPVWFPAVGQFYRDFTQVRDEEVVALRRRAKLPNYPYYYPLLKILPFLGPLGTGTAAQTFQAAGLLSSAQEAAQHIPAHCRATALQLGQGSCLPSCQPCELVSNVS